VRGRNAVLRRYDQDRAGPGVRDLASPSAERNFPGVCRTGLSIRSITSTATGRAGARLRRPGQQGRAQPPRIQRRPSGHGRRKEGSVLLHPATCAARPGVASASRSTRKAIRCTASLQRKHRWRAQPQGDDSTSAPTESEKKPRVKGSNTPAHRQTGERGASFALRSEKRARYSHRTPIPHLQPQTTSPKP